MTTQSYTLAGLGIGFAANKCMLSIFNAAGSSNVLRVYRAMILNNQLTAVTGILTNLELRKLSAASGGTVIVPTKHDNSSAGLLSSISSTMATYTVSGASWGASVATFTTPTTSATIATGTAWANNTISFTTTVAHGFSVGQRVTVSGVTPSGYNASYIIFSVPTTTTFVVAQATNPGTWTSGGTVDSGHALQVGQNINVTGVSPSGYNGVYSVASVPSANTFTVAKAVDPTTYVSGGAINPAVICGTNQAYTPTSLYRRIIWSTDEPSNASGTTAATLDEYEVFLPFGTIWSMGYSDTTTEPITLRAGEGLGLINTGGSVGQADIFFEFTVS